MNTIMKVKVITDSILAAIVFVVVSCATQTAQVESPPGRYEVHQKDDKGYTVGVYKTSKFAETFVPHGGAVLNFIDSNGVPRTMKSYDIFKL